MYIFKSTETAITHILDKLHNTASSKYGSIIILLDLSAAFDTINRDILATRLTSIGIRDTAHEWFVSYLTDRQYKVNINSTISHSHKLVTGLPQGSILGPLRCLISTSNHFFQLLTNTLPSHLFNNLSIPYFHKIRNLYIIIDSKLKLLSVFQYPLAPNYILNNL